MRHVTPKDPLFRRFQAVGNARFGKDWQRWRGAVVAKATDFRAVSSKEMFPDEMLQAIQDMEDADDRTDS